MATETFGSSASRAATVRPAVYKLWNEHMKKDEENSMIHPSTDDDVVKGLVSYFVDLRDHLNLGESSMRYMVIPIPRCLLYILPCAFIPIRKVDQ